MRTPARQISKHLAQAAAQSLNASPMLLGALTWVVGAGCSLPSGHCAQADADERVSGPEPAVQVGSTSAQNLHSCFQPISWTWHELSQAGADLLFFFVLAIWSNMEAAAPPLYDCVPCLPPEATSSECTQIQVSLQYLHIVCTSLLRQHCVHHCLVRLLSR